jgi:hypothetical protein
MSPTLLEVPCAFCTSAILNDRVKQSLIRGRIYWGTRALRPRIGCAHAARATQIYTHVMQKPGLGVRSPLDAL